MENNDSVRKLVGILEPLIEDLDEQKRLFNTLDNPLAKNFITIMINYEDYEANKDLINDYITLGYSFGVVLDSKFNGDINNLILFSYVFMSEDYELYDIMIEEKDKIKSKLIIL